MLIKRGLSLLCVRCVHFERIFNIHVVSARATNAPTCARGVPVTVGLFLPALRSGEAERVALARCQRQDMPALISFDPSYICIPHL